MSKGYYACGCIQKHTGPHTSEWIKRCPEHSERGCITNYDGACKHGSSRKELEAQIAELEAERTKLRNQVKSKNQQIENLLAAAAHRDEQLTALREAAQVVIDVRKSLGECDPHSNAYAVHAVTDMQAHGALQALLQEQVDE